jgi:hypothetical protein
VIREGIELTGSFTATVNAELKVGAVEETITVTGESPIVDVQGATQQRVITKDVSDAIPVGRSHQQLTVLIPGVTGANPDVGGSNTLGLVSLGIHGSRTTDMRVMANGVNLRNIGSPGQLISLQPEMGATQEITVDYGAGSAELDSAGLQINYIPREGGNLFSGTFFGTYVGSSFQGNNYTDELKAAGLSQPNSLKRLYDFNGALGGPIRRDKLWFFSSVRWQTNESYFAGMYYNLNAGVDSGTSYRFNLGVPNLITQYATPNARHSQLLEGAVFGQDKWTLKQFTINAGLRFDYFYTYFPEQVLGPGPLVPNRNITFSKQDWYQWKDLSPRLGLAYDLFGDGKTAFKASWSKYVLAVDPTLGNPYFNLANVVQSQLRA